MNDTPTPRTDEFARAECCDLEHALDFARQMERELADRREWSSKLADVADDLRAELAAERALADRLAGCMAHLAAYDWFIDGTESHSVVCGLPPNQVREALAAWKEARP